MARWPEWAFTSKALLATFLTKEPLTFEKDLMGPGKRLASFLFAFLLKVHSASVCRRVVRFGRLSS